MTDTHIGVGPSAVCDLKRAFRFIKRQDNLAAVVNCGDVTNVGGEKEYRKYIRLWRDSGIKARAVYTFGNHDNAAGGYQKWLRKSGYKGYTATTGARLYKNYLRRGGSFNYVTKYKYANIIAIGGYIGQKGGVYPYSSVKWLDRQLKATVRAGKMAIVVTHYAPWHGTDPIFHFKLANQTLLYGVCQSYPNVVFACGHEHLFEQIPKYFWGHYSYRTYAKAKTTRFSRVGITASKCRNKVHLLCLNSVSRVYGIRGKVVPERHAWAYLLKCSDFGTLTFVERDLTRNKTVARTTFKQETGSVAVSCTGLDAGDVAKMKVKFSDGGTYGSVKSGSAVTLGRGEKLKLPGIPRGVLVTVSAKAPHGYESVATRRVEVAKGTAKAALSFVKPAASAQSLAATSPAS